MRSTYIYVLIDPVNGELRYIGKTLNLCKRYKYHLKYDKGPTRRVAWIKLLKGKGLVPTLHVLEICNDYTWQERERYWIKFYKRSLYNHSQGGENIQLPHYKDNSRSATSKRQWDEGKMYVFTDIDRAKAYIKSRNNKYGLGNKSRTGQRQSEEEKRKKSETLKGRKFSKNTLQKMSEARFAYWRRRREREDDIQNVY